MRLQQKSILTFGEIAKLWGAEGAGTPGSLNRDQIFGVLVESLRADGFAHATLSIRQEPRDLVKTEAPDPADGSIWDGESRPPMYSPLMTMTQEILRNVIMPIPGARTSDGEPRKWPHLTLDEIEPLSCQVWLEPLRVSREDFRRWCYDQGHDRPQFWFGGEPLDQKGGQREDAAESPPMKSVASSGGQTSANDRLGTIGAETRCRERLVSLMNAGPKEKPKSEYQAESGIGTRAFQRAWAAAITETGKTGWSIPGRKSLRRIDTPIKS